MTVYLKREVQAGSGMLHLVWLWPLCTAKASLCSTQHPFHVLLWDVHSKA